MKKNVWIIIIVIVLVIAAIGGYALFHKSSKTTITSSSPATTTYTTNSSSAEIIQTKTFSGVGQYLVDSSGNTLYTYSKDTNGVSNCSGSCLYSWPIYSPSSSSAALPANVTIITRLDGSKQYAYKGMPLYTFTSDSSGQVNGNGVSDFNVAKP
jgi:predicted lipoprotein with Yx(FWY)xxD motif